jgi:dihydroorotase
MSLLILPGMVDAHVHLREPGAPHKEDVSTGTRAAGGGWRECWICQQSARPLSIGPHG